MSANYRVVLVGRNGVERTLATVNTMAEVKTIVDTPKYVGTWITDDRKLLRYGMGTVRIKRVSDYCFEEVDGEWTALLNVVGKPHLDWIRITKDRIMGLNLKKEKLWEASDFAGMLYFTDKEIAYRCSQIYDELIKTYKLEPAI